MLPTAPRQADHVLRPTDVEEYRRFYHALNFWARTDALDKFQEASLRMAEFPDVPHRESEFRRLELQDTLIELEQLVRLFPELREGFPRLLRLLSRGLNVQMTATACRGLWNIIVETWGPRVFTDRGQRMAFPVSAF